MDSTETKPINAFHPPILALNFLHITTWHGASDQQYASQRVGDYLHYDCS